MAYKIEILANHRVTKVQQIVDKITNDIDRGVLSKDDKIPSINEFSRSHAVARETVEKAYIQLKVKGYIVSVRGIGYFVDKETNHYLNHHLVL